MSDCLEPFPPDAPDTAAPPRLGWTSPHRGGQSVHCVALVSPSPSPPLPLGTRCLRPGATRRGPEGGSWLLSPCLSTAQCWDAGLQARHGLHCLRAVSGRFGYLVAGLCAPRAGIRLDPMFEGRCDSARCRNLCPTVEVRHYSLQYSSSVPGSQSNIESGLNWWTYRSAGHCARRAGARAGVSSHTSGRGCCSARHR